MDPGRFFYASFGIIFLVSFVCIAGVVMHVVRVFREKIEVDASGDIGVLVAFVGIYYMVFLFLGQQKNMARLMADLSDFSKFGKPPNFDETNERLNFFSKLLFGYGTIGASLYAVIRVVKIPQCKKINEKMGYDIICGVITPGWYPFIDVNSFPYYHLIWMFYFLTTQLFIKIVGTISYTILEIANHIILRIDHLKLMFNEVFEGNDYNTSREKLNKTIEYHIHIIDLAKRLDSYVADGMFAHFAITGVICGCLESQLVSTMQMEVVFHIMTWVFSLLVGCLGGQQLIDASLTLPGAIFGVKWYAAHPNLQKDLTLVILRSQKPLFLRAGAFGILGLPLFVSIMKTSYSVFTLLKSE